MEWYEICECCACPSKRSPCKSCRDGMREDKLRLAYKTASHFSLLLLDARVAQDEWHLCHEEEGQVEVRPVFWDRTSGGLVVRFTLNQGDIVGVSCERKKACS